MHSVHSFYSILCTASRQTFLCTARHLNIVANVIIFVHSLCTEFDSCVLFGSLWKSLPQFCYYPTIFFGISAQKKKNFCAQPKWHLPCAKNPSKKKSWFLCTTPKTAFVHSLCTESMFYNVVHRLCTEKNLDSVHRSRFLKSLSAFQFCAQKAFCEFLCTECRFLCTEPI